MKALVFHHSLPREAAAKVTGEINPRGFLAGYAPVGLEEVPEPQPPAAGWVRCETIASGICGSDVMQIRLHGARDNPLTALLSFPHVLGHEAVARRADTRERVVLDPWLGCAPRGIDPPRPACARGRPPPGVGRPPRGHAPPLPGGRRGPPPAVPNPPRGGDPRRAAPRQLRRRRGHARRALLRAREPALRDPRRRRRRHRDPRRPRQR